MSDFTPEIVDALVANPYLQKRKVKAAAERPPRPKQCGRCGGSGRTTAKRTNALCDLCKGRGVLDPSE